MNNSLEKMRPTKWGVTTSILVFLTTVGQTPMLIDRFQTRTIIIPLWCGYLLLSLRKNALLPLKGIRALLQLSVLFGVFLGIGTMCDEAYGRSDIPYVLYLALFLLLVGVMAGEFLEREDIPRIETAYILSTMIVCLNTFVTYIYSMTNIGTLYVYDTKNSTSQILLTAWVLIILKKITQKQGLFHKVFYYTSLALLTVTLLGLKSRATLIAIPVVLMWIIYHGKMDRKLRRWVITALALVLIMLIANPNLLNSLVYNVVFANRSATDINELTSGRAIEWQTFLADFIDSPFWGHGRMKRESLLLTALLEFGILGGGMVLLIALWPLRWSLRYLGKRDGEYLTMTSIAIIYTLNGLFEQLAPFGPGVKCFYLWFFSGVLISIKRKESYQMYTKRGYDHG